MLEVGIFEAPSEPRSNESACSGWLAVLLAVERLGCLLGSLGLLELLRLLLQFCVRLPHFLVFLFKIDQLAEKQVAVVFLTGILDLELLVFELQQLVVVVNFLSHLSHRFEVLVEFLLSFLEVVLIGLLAQRFGAKLLFDIANPFVELLENFVSLDPQSLSDESLGLADLLFDFFEIIGKLSDAVAPELVVHELCVLFLNLSFLRNYFGLLAVVDVDSIEEQVIFVVDFVIDDCEGVRGVVLLFLKQVVDDGVVSFFPGDVHLVFFVEPVGELLGPALGLLVLLKLVAVHLFPGFVLGVLDGF